MHPSQQDKQFGSCTNAPPPPKKSVIDMPIEGQEKLYMY